MNKISKSLLAVARWATVAILGTVLSMGADAKTKATAKMTIPDFAYPQTVEKNADEKLSKAISSGDWSAAIEAVIQSVTARNIINHQNVASGIAKADSLATTAPAEWQPVFLLIKGQLLNAIYDDIRWQADTRKLDIDSIPDNPFEWSRDIFAEQIYNIGSEILEKGSRNETPLKDWKEFLENTDNAFASGMTVGEWLEMQCFQLLGQYSDATKDIIPFFSTNSEPTTPTQKCTALRDRAINMYIAQTQNLNQHLLLAKALTDKANITPFSLRMRALLEAYDLTKGTEGEQLILSTLRDYVDEERNGTQTAFPYDKREYMTLLEKSLESFPKGMYANSLKNILNDLTQPSADVRYRSQYLSSTPIEMDVTLSNASETWLLIYDYSPYLKATNSPKTSEIASKCRLVKAVKASAEGKIPFLSNTKADVGKLPKGTYVVVTSASSDSKGIYAGTKNDRWHQPFTVSDISVMSLQYPDAKTRVFVVDGANGRPIEGAQVKVYIRKNYSSPQQLSKTLTTGKDGSVTVTDERFSIEASYNGSIWNSDIRYFNSAQRTDTTTHNHVELLADRALLHPGDSISAAIITYSSRRNNLNILNGLTTEIRLLDANDKQVASQNVVSDKSGRATVSFRIPDEGLLGSWSLRALDEKGKWLGSVAFQVADYVAPTFFITSEKSEEDVAPGDVVRLKGQVMTYSGMPVANATVKYSVTYTPPMRWYMQSGATFDSSVTSDTEGKYVIELPTSNLKGTQFERGIFTVRLAATSPSGETQNGPIEKFAIGEEFNILPASGGMLRMDADNGISEIMWNVTDMIGRKVKKEVKYSMINATTKTTVAEGRFTSPTLKLPAKDYPSAIYTIEVSLADDDNIKSSTSFTIWRKTDKNAPEGTKLWVPTDKVVAGKDVASVNITVGSGISDRWIPAVLSADGEILSVDWLHIEKDNLSFPVNVPKGTRKYMLNLNYLSDLDPESADVSIYPYSAEDNLQIATETFRDKIMAGDEEHWSFRFFRKSGNAAGIPALAVMTDASLNAITPFKWDFNTSGMWNGVYYSMRKSINHESNMHTDMKSVKYLPNNYLLLPEINDYGQSWGLRGGGMYYLNGAAYVVSDGIKNEVFASVETSSRPLMMKSAGATMVRGLGDMKEEVAMDDAIAVEEEAQEAPMAGSEGAPTQESGELHESECPVAFFMPYLISDKDGTVTLDFTVPNFNTTWALQLLGYDPDMQVAMTRMEAVASKPIMVSTHSPRFVRTGDEITLTATVFNNSDETVSTDGRIELVDLISGTTISAKDFPAESVSPMGNRLITMKWKVSSGISTVGFRAYAKTDSHRDGEQALLPVLPASSPVVESTQFWLAPGQQSQSVKLPKFKDTDQVTLQYCDNPAWFCLTALPDITKPESKSVTRMMSALFGNAIAYNLISSQPQLRKGLETMLSDKDSEFAALKSNLEKDGNLKIVQLNNTPWVNNAESETLRMSNLSSLLNDEEARKSISQILDDVKGLQQPDGGWSWCPNMESSSYITRDVLRHFSMIERNGAMKLIDGADNMIKAGIGYVDRETLKDYHKYHKKGESLSYLLEWLYVRSSFPESLIPKGASTNEINTLATKALKDIAKEWKDMGIGSKAKAAMLLSRSGESKTASAILESLRQFASESPEKGMWFANQNSGWRDYSTLQTTTLVLQAFAEIQPSNKIVDSLRQWLVLCRQYQDWGKITGTVETVNAILTSGSDWTKESGLPEFSIKGKRLNLPEISKLTGSFTLTLDAKEASKKELTVERSGNGPAWGGVISQYVAPILDVKPASVPDLSIKKQIVALMEGDDGILTPKEGITLKKGMKVRVTLTINAGRDMDYVAVTDERSACLEPIDQLSGYTRSDGIGFYREVRDSQTNLFFGWLPKGDHVVSYDCVVSQEGEFCCGIATLQSQYSPSTTAHSAGELLKAE